MALDLGAWSAGSWAAAGAWATVALYVVLAIYAIKQVGEARRLREAQLRPYVVVDFAVNWLTNLYIENIGQTVARDIRVSFDPPLASTMKRPWAWEESTLFSDGISTLPPRKRIEVFFDSMISRYESDLPLRYTATVTYTGVGNRNFTDDYVLDLGMYKGTPPPPDAIPELVKAVEKLSKEVEKWTDSGGGLRVNAEKRERLIRNRHRWAYLQQAQRIRKDDGLLAVSKHLVTRALARRGWIR